MTSSDDDALPNDAKLPADNQGASKDSNGSALSLAAAILGVCIVYIVVLDWRFPYIHQLPVFDLDYITSVTMMWARNWWIEGPWHMLFSMPHAPLSVETATPDLRHGMYQSWPPGAVLSLYLVAKLTNTEPNITMINWLNVASHAAIALFLSLSGWIAAGVLHRPAIDRVALAIVASCLVLFPRGPVFFFSQVYTFDTHIVMFYALLVFAATLELAAASTASATRCYFAQLAILVSGLFVDWLFYFVYAVWFVLRLVGAQTGYGRPLGRKEAYALTLLPLVTFSVFLVWRFVTPGSVGVEQGAFASIRELVWKFMTRIGDNPDDYPLSATAFFGQFYESHRYLYWNSAPILIGTGFIVCLVLSVALFLMSRTDLRARKTYFGLFSIFLLSIIPAYAQLIVFKQHTAIHPWSLAKVVVPLAIVPGVFLPLLTIAVVERWQRKSQCNWVWRVGSSLGVLAFAIWLGVTAWPRQAPYLLGRVEPAAAVPWLTIHDTTSYRDVVISPDFAALEFGVEAAVAGKVVYKVNSFAEIDPLVSHICEPFNVVVVRKGQDASDTFDGRKADRTEREGGLTLLHFQNYHGAAKSCPKV